MEKNKHLILFFTQYGAMSYSKLLEKEGIRNLTRPVPRALSSSCGICVEASLPGDATKFVTEDVEAIYIADGEKYQLIYSNEEE